MNQSSDSTVLFLHIPKTAGTTLSKWLHQGVQTSKRGKESNELHQELTPKRFIHDGVYYYPIGFFKDPAHQLPAHVTRCLQRSDVKAVVGHFSYGLHRYIPKPARYITILRDPVERIFSLYHHLQTTGVLSDEVTIETFVEGCPEDAWQTRLSKWHPLPPEFSEHQIRHVTRSITDNDQTRRIAGAEPGFGRCTSAHLNTALRNIREEFLLAGASERFDESLVLAAQRLGWSKTPGYLPHLINRSKPSTISLSEQSRGLIEERNRLDVQLYQAANEMLSEAIDSEGSQFLESLEEFLESNQENMDRNESSVRAMSIGSDPVT